MSKVYFKLLKLNPNIYVDLYYTEWKHNIFLFAMFIRDGEASWI